VKARAGKAQPKTFELYRVPLDFLVGVADGLLDEVSAAAVPLVPEVWWPLMPGVVVVGGFDDPVTEAVVG
jgi:hypothetical protein